MGLPIKGSAEGAWQAIQGLKARSARGPWQAAADLDHIFRAGATPQGLNGRCEGMLVMTTQGVLDGPSRRLAALWMPWLGKRFDRAAGVGDNLFTGGAAAAGRLIWPGYSFRPLEPGLFTAFDFRTYTGPGLTDADRVVLKIDYDLDLNPGFLIRNVLDELVEVGPSTYLGKVHMRGRGGWKMMGYFALRPDPLSQSHDDELTVWESAEVTEEPTPTPRKRKSRKRGGETETV
jgi:hypothetical protein